MRPDQILPAVLAALFFIHSPTPPANADIVGGEEVSPKDPVRKSIAAVYEPGAQGGALCTASLIGPNTAVTAAHCINPRGPRPVMIFGNDVRSPQTEKRVVTEVVVNPQWRSHQGLGMDQGDIALIKFQGALPKGYHPVPMAEANAPIKRGETAILAGYGISDARRRAGAGILRKAPVRVDNPRTGKTEMILDQSRGRGACHGDSGGPAFVRRNGKVVLAGVTNRSYPPTAPDDCAHKVVYTKVSAYNRWIKATQERFENERSQYAAAKNLKSVKRKISHRLRKEARHQPIRHSLNPPTKTVPDLPPSTISPVRAERPTRKNSRHPRHARRMVHATKRSKAHRSTKEAKRVLRDRSKKAHQSRQPRSGTWQHGR